MYRRFIIGIAAVALGGCYSMQGSERILDRHGMPTVEVPSGSIFKRDFRDAYDQRLRRVDDVALNKRMLTSGFTHVYTFCDNYFDLMGIRQRRTRVTRDAIAPISALITGIIALHSFEKNTGSKEDLLAGLGLATAGTTSALDIYDEHMLFGAENIGAVETLTMAALSEHAAAVDKLPNMTFDAATRHLIDNQAICSPQHILTLAREAIKEGKPAASQTPTTPTTPPVTTGAGTVNRPPPGDPNKRVDVSIENR